MNKRVYGLGSVLAVASVVPFAVACTTADNKVQTENKVQLEKDKEKQLSELESKVKYFEGKNKNLSEELKKFKSIFNQIQKESNSHLMTLKKIFDEVVAGYNKIKANPIKISDKITIAINVIEDLEFDVLTVKETIKSIIDAIEGFKTQVETQLQLLKVDIEKLIKELNNLKQEGERLDKQAKKTETDMEKQIQNDEEHNKDNAGISGSGELTPVAAKLLVETVWEIVKTQLGDSIMPEEAIAAIRAFEPALVSSDSKKFNKTIFLGTMLKYKINRGTTWEIYIHGIKGFLNPDGSGKVMRPILIELEF